MGIRVNQDRPEGISYGTEGVSRADLWLGKEIFLDGGTGTFALVKVPPMSLAELSADSSFVPDMPGSYRLSLTSGTNIFYMTVRVMLDSVGNPLLDSTRNVPSMNERGAESNYPTDYGLAEESKTNEYGWGEPQFRQALDINRRLLAVPLISDLVSMRNEGHIVDVVWVSETLVDRGPGAWLWVAGSTTTHDGKDIIQPGHSTTSPLTTGRWIRETYATGPQGSQGAQGAQGNQGTQGRAIAVPIQVGIFAGIGLTRLDTPTRIAANRISLANYPTAIAGQSRNQSLVVTLEVTTAGNTAHAYLYNVTRSEIVAGVTLTTTSPSPVTQTVSLTSGSGVGNLHDGDTYELDIWLTDPLVSTDRAICTYAAIEVTYA